MGGPPAVLIVVRHGARLDAADKQWHLTSPTPYDPPLTYGGWTQSRALGARIASILRARDTDDVEPNQRKRRHKVVVHTSPFLRCIQTGIAICAGLAQNPGHTHLQRHTSINSHNGTSQSSKIPPALSTDSPRLKPIYEREKNGTSNEGQANIKKSILRLDAFLGEWLSPDYFELITPPPGSVMMLAGAKAELLRHEDYSHLIHVKEASSSSSAVGFPGGWGSPVVALDSNPDEKGTLSLSSLGAALPRRDRTSSLSSVESSGSRHSTKSLNKVSTTNPVEHGIYQPPVPVYAISNSDKIPPGYVSHARDSCVDIDYAWDSMRAPQNWGNGGEYGEEWSSMHIRFRKGLQHLVQWYHDNEDGANLVTKVVDDEREKRPQDDPEDEDTDLVVILVTHGAGCNALIGALTNQPVLMDVGMASLTMAVRKTSRSSTPATSPTGTPKNRSRASSISLVIPDEYDVKLVANTEHLRPSTSSSPAPSRSTSVSGFPAYRPKYGAYSGAVENTSGDYGRGSISSTLGSMRRTPSVVSPSLTANYSPVRSGSIGLWTAPRPAEDTAVEDPLDDDMVLNFGHDETKPSLPSAKVELPVALDLREIEEDTISPLGGLWGPSRPPGEAERNREMAPKRRWTVHEKSIA